jgi:hypothetical protein
VGHVARMEVGRGAYRLWLGGPKVGDHWEDLGVGGRITLRWTLGRQGSMGRTGLCCLMIGPVAGFCEDGDEPSGSIKKAIVGQAK